jgi:endonuclease YncB( thermonuclease family)
MATNSRILIGAMVVTAAMVVALPVAKAIDAATLSPAPSVSVNRAAKGDQLASRRQPAKQMPVQMIRKPSDQKQKQQIMDGCDPLFSPVAVPQMAHVSGRCVG